jgi:hypothetical protein
LGKLVTNLLLTGYKTNKKGDYNGRSFILLLLLPIRILGFIDIGRRTMGQMLTNLQALASDNLIKVDVLSGDDIETWHREFPDPTNPSVDEWDGCGLGAEAWYDGFET